MVASFWAFIEGAVHR